MADDSHIPARTSSLKKDKGPAVPQRTLSPKKSHKRESSRDFDMEERGLKAREKKSAHSINSFSSKTSGYWLEKAIYDSLMAEESKLSRDKYNAGEAQTKKSLDDITAEIQMYEEEAAFSTEIAVFMESNHEIPLEWTESWTTNFITSASGWQIPATPNEGPGSHLNRDNSIQSTLRKDLIKIYNTEYPQGSGPPRDRQWCAISGGYRHTEYTTAAHIVPDKCSAENFKVLFPDKEFGILHSPHNCMIMANDIEKLFEAGLIALETATKNMRSKQDVRSWMKSSPRVCRVRVVDKTDKRLTKLIPNDSEPDKTYAELDGEVVQWKSNHRPSARFLAFHLLYCLYKRLRLLKAHEKKNLMKEEFNKAYWGSAGPWLKRSMLRGLFHNMTWVTPLDPGDLQSMEDTMELPPGLADGKVDRTLPHVLNQITSYGECEEEEDEDYGEYEE